MKKYMVLIGVSVALIFVFFSRYFVFAKHVKVPNPMSYIYHEPIQDVRKKLIDMFSNGRFHNFYFYIGYDSIERKMLNLTDSQNHNHYFVNWFGVDSFNHSEIYYNWWGKLQLIPRYHIILDSLSTHQTMISIKSLPKVEAGTVLTSNHGLPYMTARKVAVKPSTIEEYDIIKKIGDQLGEKKMPLINL